MDLPQQPIQFLNVGEPTNGGIFDKLWGFVNSVFVLILVGIMLLVCYVIYLIYTYAYPRLGIIGHTSPFEAYMDTHITDMFSTLGRLQSEDKCPFQKEITDFLTAIDIEPNKPELSIDLYPDPYFIFAFYDDLTKIADCNCNYNRLSLMTIFVNYDNPKISRYFEKGSGQTIDTKKIQNLVNAFKTFVILQNVVKNAVKPYIKNTTYESDLGTARYKIELFTLNLLINEYLNDIKKSYTFRKSGGIANFTIYEIFMEDYIHYVFIETIPNIWKNFFKDLVDDATQFSHWFTGRNAQTWVMKLPLKIAGMDHFVQDPQIEHFGFPNPFAPLIAIGKVFTSLLGVAKGLGMIVANPLNFLKLLIGLILGFIIFAIYTLLCVVVFLIAYPVAFCFMIPYKMYITVYWTSMFLTMSIVYTVLWILDFATGGLIMRMMRCENLPDAWYNQPGFAKDNKYQRVFLCQTPCRNRYTPSGGLCEKMNQSEPSFCPQQTLYQTYRDQTFALMQTPLTYAYKPGMKYYSMSKDDRKDVWDDMYSGYSDFSKQCGKGMQQYDHISKAVCNYYMFDEEYKKTNPTNFEKIKNVCKNAYCDMFVDEGKSPSVPYCVGDPEEDSTDEIAAARQAFDPITAILILCLILVISIIIFNIIYKNSSQVVNDTLYDSLKSKAKELASHISHPLSQITESILPAQDIVGDINKLTKSILPSSTSDFKKMAMTKAKSFFKNLVKLKK